VHTFISLVAQYAVYLSLLVALVVWLRLPRVQKWEFALTAVIGGAIAVGLMLLGGALYHDTRPFVAEHVAPFFPHAADSGFPSDHTLLAMFVAMCVLFYSRRWGVVLLVVTAAVGWARVAALVHRPIDIIAAAAFSVVAALIARPLALWVMRRVRRSAPPQTRQSGQGLAPTPRLDRK
jgi:undecaprenyl-diphosphatase